MKFGIVLISLAALLALAAPLASASTMAYGFTGNPDGTCALGSTGGGTNLTLLPGQGVVCKEAVALAAPAHVHGLSVSFDIYVLNDSGQITVEYGVWSAPSPCGPPALPQSC